jgi:prevent-host-death family protein
MDQAISAAEANRAFSRLLRDVKAGASFTITSHGKPVARIVPYDATVDAKAAARARLLQRLAHQAVTDIGPWRRDELYER